MFLILPLYAKDFSFSVTPNTGITYGKLGEYLYSSFSNYLLSYLEWDEKPLFMEGVTFGAAYKNNKIDFGVEAALPVKCGRMTDSDWKTYNVKTNYSIFDLYPIFAGNANLRYSYIFEKDDFSFGPGVSVDLGYRSLKGKNGYGWNGGSKPWDTEGLPKKRYSGIDYSLLNTAVNIEVQGSYNVNNFSFGLLLGIAPFTYAKVTDYHSDENTYTDPSKAQDFTTISTHMALFKRISGTFDFEYKMSSKFSICSSLKGLAVFNIKGPTLTDAYSDDGTFEGLYQDSGYDQYELSFNVGCRYKW